MRRDDQMILSQALRFTCRKGSSDSESIHRASRIFRSSGEPDTQSIHHAPESLERIKTD